MKLQKLLSGTEPLSQYYIVIIRVIMGMLFIYHGRELFDFKAMSNFAAWLKKDLNFPLPLLMAYLRTGAEFFGGIMLILGLFTRLASFLICFTMLVAGFVVDKGDFFGEGEMPFAYAAILFTIFLVGPSKLSLDYYFFKK